LDEEMDAHRIYGFFFNRFRPARIRRFFSAMQIRPDSSVLDVGGGTYFWELARELGLPPLRVSILNVTGSHESLSNNVSWVIGDGRRLPFGDGTFDVVFCNSVIEHVGERRDQQLLADEIRRVGRGYFVQTPDRSFPVEPHLLTPFVHWLPSKLRCRVVPTLTLRGMIGKLTEAEKQELRAIRLLNCLDMQGLFPDATINREYFCGLPKSILAVRSARQDA
jgi:hypothetical protein